MAHPLEALRRPGRFLAAIATAVALAFTASCTVDVPRDTSKTLRIVAGSEQKAVLEQVVMPWCKDQHYQCEYTLMGSVDQARLLQSGSRSYDAYWFASSVFAQVGNTKGELTELQPMFLTPIVFAGRESTMKKLGFADNPNVGMADILSAIEAGKMKTWTTNPTQSNSGATTLFAFLNHVAGNDAGQPLTMEQLDSPKVDAAIKAFVRAMDRTPPSTGTMMEQCIEPNSGCETLFTYEALVIEYNQRLVRSGQEPLVAVYPRGALAISDAPLGFLPGENADEKRAMFLKLQDYLLNDEKATGEIRSLGRRPATSIGLVLDNPDTSVFNPAWGIKTDIKEQGIAYPAAPVIEAALDRYHTRYRPAVTTYYCLDGSGSMTGEGWKGVQAAAHELFDAQRAQANRLQTGPDDTTTVAIFNHGLKAGPYTVKGNDAAQLAKLERDINTARPGGGTNMYNCLVQAEQALASASTKKLIVLMTDGQSDRLNDQVVGRLANAGIPVIAIAFGDADPAQLEPIARDTKGAFVKSDDLVKALREAAGYK